MEDEFRTQLEVRSVVDLLPVLPASLVTWGSRLPAILFVGVVLEDGERRCGRGFSDRGGASCNNEIRIYLTRMKMQGNFDRTHDNFTIYHPQ